MKHKVYLRHLSFRLHVYFFLKVCAISVSEKWVFLATSQGILVHILGMNPAVAIKYTRFFQADVLMQLFNVFRAVQFIAPYLGFNPCYFYYDCAMIPGFR